MFPRKKGHKKDVAPISPLTPPSMETDDLDPAYVIFHQPLPIAARRSDHIWGAVPSPIRLAVDWLNKKGLHEEGLYRVPGKATTFATYKALFDRGVEFDFFELHEMAPENVAMVLIKYLQALPEPIYSSKYEAHFKLALAIQNDQERATVLKGIMYMIPLAYRETIKVLVDHLRLVASNSEVNKMTIRNVELTWSLSVGQMTGALMKVLGESPFPVPSTLHYSGPLELAMENTPRSMTTEVFKVPYAVTTLVKFLKENDGPAHPNLFSTEPKSHDLIEDIVYVLNGGSVNAENTLPAEMTTVDAAVALKLWISSIPGEAGLFPEAMRPDFVRICPPPAEGKSVNFGTMPDKLEALVWKLPDAHLETIKTITNFLRQWTTYAPEDMTSIRAIELVFPSYPVPLQHVLAYLLHHHDSLFLADDSDLTAHLQSLVFGGLNGAAIGGVGVGIGLASPGGAMPLAALSSPLITSPRQYAANTAKPQSNPTSPAVNRTTPDPGIATTSPPGGENAVSADATVAAPSSSATSPVTTDDTQSASESPVFSTPEREGKKKKDKSTDSPSTPGTKAKKSKTLKIGSTTSSPAKIKKIKEAEDTASPSKSDKAKTPKSEKAKDKTPKSSPKVIAAATVSASSSDPAVASIGSTSSESTPKSKKAKLAKSPSSSTETPTPSSEASPPSKDKKKPAIIEEEVPVTAQPTSTASKTNLSRSASSDLGEAHDSGSSKEESSSTSTATTSTAMTASTVTVTTVSVPSPTLPASSAATTAATASTSTTATTQSESTPTGSPSSGRVSSGRPGSGRAQRRGEKELAALLTSIVAANEEEMAAKQKAKEEKRASADKRKELTEKEAPANEDGDSQDGSGEEDNDEEDVLAAMVVPGSPPTRVQRKSGKRKSDPANASPSTASPGDGDSTSSSSSKKKRRSKESVEDDPPSESGSQREGESERSTESNGKKRRVKSTEIASADIVTGLDDGTDKPKKRKSGDVPSNGTPERSEKRRSKKLEDGILTETGSSGDSTASPGDSSSGSPGKATRKEKVAAAAVTDPAATASPKKNRIKVSTATET